MIWRKLWLKSKNFENSNTPQSRLAYVIKNFFQKEPLFFTDNPSAPKILVNAKYLLNLYILSIEHPLKYLFSKFVLIFADLWPEYFKSLKNGPKHKHHFNFMQSYTILLKLF